MLILLISACSSKTNQAKIQSEATQNKGIVGRLTKQLVEEAHPTVDSTCCINEIQQKKQCGLCKAACHVSTLDKITHPDFTHCDDCGICVAHCPAPVFTNSPSLTQKLMTLVEHTNQTIVLSCHHSEKEADCKLSCLAAYPLGGAGLSCHKQQSHFLFTRSV